MACLECLQKAVRLRKKGKITEEEMLAMIGKQCVHQRQKQTTLS